MQVPFPELTNLRLSYFSPVPPVVVIPDSFLNGSAPRLQYFNLRRIPFPGLPKLLLSATHFVELKLADPSHYIPPEAMAALLSVSSSLRIFHLDFLFSRSRPASGLESRSLPLPKRFILPALCEFHFLGHDEYLEDLAARIDSPKLDDTGSFIYNLWFDCLQLAQFIDRSPTLRVRDEAYVEFFDYSVTAALPARSRTLMMGIGCGKPDHQLSSVAQLCNSTLDPISAVEGLYIKHRYRKLVWENDAVNNTLWLQLLLPFTAVNNLYLSEEFALGIAATLQGLVEGRRTKVLPSLQNIFIEWFNPLGSYQENIRQFVAARQLSDQHITISSWDRGYKPSKLM